MCDMQEISNMIEVDVASMPQFEVIEEIVYYDGIWEAWVRGDDKQDYLAKWADRDEEYHRWFLIPVKAEDMKTYLEGKFEMCLFERPPETRIWVLDQNGEGFQRAYRVMTEDIPDGFGAMKGCFHDPEVTHDD